MGVLFQGCIGDDFINDEVEPEVRISTNVDTIEINTSFQFDAMYLNNIGVEEEVDFDWISSDISRLTINNQGLAQAIAIGDVRVYCQAVNTEILDSIDVVVGNSTIINEVEKSGSISTTSSYLLQGDFTIVEDSGSLLIEFAENYAASTALPGLYAYMSNNRNSISDAYEIGMVTTFSGEHSYTIPDVDINEYSYLVYFCKPFNVKVGDGEIQ